MTTFIANKKAGLNYEMLEKFEAGIELFGFEVKSIRSKLGSLDGAYVIMRGGEVYLVNAYIPPFQPNNTDSAYEPRRNRKLLLTKGEIRKIANQEDKKGLTIVPISVYNKGRKIKIEIAVSRGKKKYDKREDIKKRESERDIQRSLRKEF